MKCLLIEARMNTTRKQIIEYHFCFYCLSCWFDVHWPKNQNAQICKNNLEPQSRCESAFWITAPRMRIIVVLQTPQIKLCEIWVSFQKDPKLLILWSPSPLHHRQPTKTRTTKDLPKIQFCCVFIALTKSTLSKSMFMPKSDHPKNRTCKEAQTTKWHHHHAQKRPIAFAPQLTLEITQNCPKPLLHRPAMTWPPNKLSRSHLMNSLISQAVAT